MIQESLKEALFNKRKEWFKTNTSPPELKIVLSRDGYARICAHVDDITNNINFKDPLTQSSTVFGYPFTIDAEQQEDFTIEQVNHG